MLQWISTALVAGACRMSTVDGPDTGARPSLAGVRGERFCLYIVLERQLTLTLNRLESSNTVLTLPSSTPSSSPSSSASSSSRISPSSNSLSPSRSDTGRSLSSDEAGDDEILAARMASVRAAAEAADAAGGRSTAADILLIGFDLFEATAGQNRSSILVRRGQDTVGGRPRRVLPGDCLLPGRYKGIRICCL